MFRTLRWSLVLFLVAAGVGWWQFQKVWSRRDELLTGEIRTRLAQLAPDWRIEFSRAELSDDAQVTLTDVMIGPRLAARPLLEVPQIRLQLDRDLLADGLQVLVTRVDARSPILHVLRGADGAWNWQGLPPIPQGDRPAPEIHLHEGRVKVRLAADDFIPLTEFELRDIETSLTPTAYRQYQIAGRTSLDAAGALTFDGALDLTTGRWNLTGVCDDLQSTDSLLKLAAGVSQQAREQLQALAVPDGVPRFAPLPPGVESSSGVPIRIASDGSATPPVHEVAHTGAGQAAEPAPSRPPHTGGPSRCVIPALGVAANLQVAFTLDGESFGAPIQYQVAARVSNGVIDNPALPVPLYDLRGDFFIDNRQIVVRELQAANRESRLFIDGRIARAPLPPARSFTIRAANLAFGRDIRQHLPPNLLRIYDCLRPEGRFNVDVAFETDGESPPKVTLNQFEAFDSSILPDVFAYPVQNVRGNIRQQGDRFLCDFTGVAGNRPVTARGEFRNPGPNLVVQIAVEVDGLPIDPRLREAFVLPQHAGVQRALERLRLTGLVDADLNLVKTGRDGEKLQLQLDAAVHDASLNFADFPYQVEKLSGRVRFDPLDPDPARRETWDFTDVAGVHGGAKISGAGSFSQVAGSPLLDLRLTALQVPIDPSLEFACVQANPVVMVPVFNSLGSTGSVDLEQIRVLWTPDAPPVVSLPRIIVKDAALRLVWLPYMWDRVTGVLGWQNQRLTIAQLSGWHGRDTYLQIDSGGEAEAAVVEFPAQGDVAWHLHLEDVRISKLVADEAFRSSLHTAPVVADVVNQLNPTGPLDLSLGIDLKGFRSQPDVVTAAWNLDLTLPRNNLDAGVDLADVKGKVKIPYGSWDGRRAFLEGSFQLDRATVWEIPFQNVSGPFLLEGDDFFVGLPTWPELNRAPAYTEVKGEQVKADVYGGRIGCDVHVKLARNASQENEYRAEVNLFNAQLRQWALDSGLSGERLYGDVNGRIDYVIGRGSSDRTLRGSGWLQISPAQLYEAPVLNRILASLEMSQPDSTAFNYAYGEFTMHDGLFDFSKIDLVGESLRMVGRGTVAFGEGLNERVAIDFYRSKFRNRIPVVGVVLSALTTNSIGVEVRGTVDNPQTRVLPKLGVIDDALRNLIDAFDAGQNPMLPRPLWGPNTPPTRPIGPGTRGL